MYYTPLSVLRVNSIISNLEQKKTLQISQKSVGMDEYDTKIYTH